MRTLALAPVVALALAACSAGSGAGGNAEKPLRTARSACTSDLVHAPLGDNGQTLTLDGKGEDDADGLPTEVIRCILDKLGTTDAVIKHIESTRALDGMQNDTWPGYKARWTYHPANGLKITIQAV